MDISNKAVLLAVSGILLALFIIEGCRRKKQDRFTRTPITADTNCKFVRSPVDYMYNSSTDVNAKMGRAFPHMMGRPSDKLQPLEDAPVDLLKDENLLWNQGALFQQYTNDFKGCGNGKPYIVNDEKTRWALRAVGDESTVRMLNSLRGPEHGPNYESNPALTEQDLVQPDEFDKLYGGSSYVNGALGD